MEQQVQSLQQGFKQHSLAFYAFVGNSSSPTHLMFTADSEYLVSNSKVIWQTHAMHTLHPKGHRSSIKLL
eukprot:6138040-Amphidinium_carterae.2